MSLLINNILKKCSQLFQLFIQKRELKNLNVQSKSFKNENKKKKKIVFLPKISV